MSIESSESPRSIVSLSPMLGRRWLFTAIIVVLLANAVATKVMAAIADLGLLNAAASGLGLSWAFWLSAALCIRLAALEPDRPARPMDLWICAACLAAAMLPVSPLSALASTFLVVFLLLNRSAGAYLRAAAMVLAAICVQLLWSRLLMLVFVGPVAAIDAGLVGLLLQTPVDGNTVYFADGKNRLSILAACTSVENASIALMLFVAIVRTFRPAPRRLEIAFLAGVFLSVVVINLVRLSLMAQSMPMFHLIHGDQGWVAINAIITLTGLTWAVACVRREIFR